MLYIITIPTKTIATCFIKFDKINPFPKLELALYTGKKENIANSRTIDQIILSPFILSKKQFHYSFLTAFLNCVPLSSKFLYKSKLEHAGDNKTVSLGSAIL